eukprot:gene2372-2934_t
MSIPQQIQKIGWIIGKFKGVGKGVYPTIKPFTYVEEIEFTHITGKPVLRYTQNTYNPETGNPIHLESGFLRSPKEGVYELVVTQITGVSDIYDGVLKEDAQSGELTLEFTLKSISRSSSAKAPHVTNAFRSFKCNPTNETDKNKIVSYFDMATETTPSLTRHLDIIFERQL